MIPFSVHSLDREELNIRPTVVLKTSNTYLLCILLVGSSSYAQTGGVCSLSTK
jgi:hypothetical protein